MSPRPTTANRYGAVRAAISRSALQLQSDERLVTLVRAGSEPAFEAIVGRYRLPLVRYCKRLLGADRAEDVVQETFMSAFAVLGDDDRAVHLKPWLYRVAHNLTVNALRKHGFGHDRLDDNLDGVPQPPELFEQRQRLRTLLGQIGELPERQRSALLLREFEGRSYEEIARELDATVPIIRQLLHRARTRLRNGVGGLVPLPWLQSWLAGAPSASLDPQRMTELVAGAQATGGLAKVGITVLVAGTVAAGAGVGASERGDEHPSGAPTNASAPASADAASGGDRRGHGAAGDPGNRTRQGSDKSNPSRGSGRGRGGDTSSGGRHDPDEGDEQHRDNSDEAERSEDEEPEDDGGKRRGHGDDDAAADADEPDNGDREDVDGSGGSGSGHNGSSGSGHKSGSGN